MRCFWLWNIFSLPAPQEMYKEQCGEYAYWCESGRAKAYERTKEPHYHLNTPKLKNIPSQNYQELSKLKILGLNALTINCTQSAIPCIAFCLQFLFAFSLQLTFGLPAVPLSWFKRQSVVSEVYSWLLQFASFSPRNGKLHCQCSDRDFF